jgi:hypothetical protein
MVILGARIVSAQDLSQFAWAGLRRFQNVGYVESEICRVHKVIKKHLPNAKKQATQIRYCLVQAREYFDASQNVTLATKPNLMYYSIMSLVFSEILFKHGGDSSLDKAREQHKYHGLEFRFDPFPKSAPPFYP